MARGEWGKLKKSVYVYVCVCVRGGGVELCWDGKDWSALASVSHTALYSDLSTGKVLVVEQVQFFWHLHYSPPVLVDWTMDQFHFFQPPTLMCHTYVKVDVGFKFIPTFLPVLCFSSLLGSMLMLL